MCTRRQTTNVDIRSRRSHHSEKRTVSIYASPLLLHSFHGCVIVICRYSFLISSHIDWKIFSFSLSFFRCQWLCANCWRWPVAVVCVFVYFSLHYGNLSTERCARISELYSTPNLLLMGNLFFIILEKNSYFRTFSFFDAPYSCILFCFRLFLSVAIQYSQHVR